MQQPEKITEIAICVFDGFEVVETFHTLVNPRRSIDPYVSRMTGITERMLVGKPIFEDLHEQILKITEGCIFTAHNASFDYPIIRKEFNYIGIDYNRPRLCTVQAARKVLPGFDKYGLENLCKKLQITNTAPHRALGDAMATVEVLKIILQNDYNNQVKKLVKKV